MSFAFSPACSAFMARRHAIVLELGKAHLQAGLHTRNATKTRPPRTISHASPLAATPGAKIVRATLDARRKRLILLFE
jgi:hypothetical protein